MEWQGLTLGWYVLGYSPSSWSSLAGSLWKERARVWAGDEMRLIACGSQRTARNINVYGHYLNDNMQEHGPVDARALGWRDKRDTFCVMGERGPMTDKRRGFVLAMARRGELASLEEGAAISSTTKATVRRWLVGVRIDWLLTRRQWLARRHDHCERWANDQPPPMRPTKAQMRKQIADAIRRTERAAKLEKQRQTDSGRRSPAE